MKPALQKVMLVDDNSDIRAIVKLALEKVGGLTVCACESGPEALEKLAEFKPQLVLLDVMMPDMDGPTVFKRIREQTGMADIAIVFLTAKATNREIQTLLALGPLDVIVKPFDPITLHEQVKALWANARR
jgi:CheY-like chemotaxis protein